MLKNKKISIVFLFVCIFLSTVFTTISYAETIEPNVTYYEGAFSSTSLTSIGSYTKKQVNQIINNYVSDSITYETDFITLCEEVYSTYGFNSYVLIKNVDKDNNLLSYSHRIYFLNSIDEVGVCSTVKQTGTPYYRIFLNISANDTFLEFSTNNSSGSCILYTCSSSGFISSYISYFINLLTNVDIKEVTFTTNPVSFIWDGTSYYYKSPVDTPEEPTFPTNQEIANAVQKFYNSDIYKNNEKFSDFFVVYYIHNQTFAFIGHTIPTHIDQVKIPANMTYNGKTYSADWWKFKGDETVSSTDLGSLFYLYTTSDFGETFHDDGVGRIYELFGLDFSTNATIVYSTQDYDVITFTLDETTGSYTETKTTNTGEDYIISEELTPTINPFNPFDDTIEGDASQTIISNANMEELKNKFEEFKDLFIFGEDMQWLISANNKLSNYFIGFIVMCAWFFAIGRILKG